MLDKGLKSADQEEKNKPGNFGVWMLFNSYDRQYDS